MPGRFAKFTFFIKINNMASSSSSTNKPRGNFLARYVDPIVNARTLDGRVLAVETLAKIVAIVITSLGFFVWGASIAAQYGAPEWLQYVVGGLFAGLSAWITDMAFSDFLENSLFQALSFFQFKWYNSSTDWYTAFFLKPLRWVVVTAIVAGLFYADYNSVYTLRSPIANAKEKSERVNFKALDAAQRQRIADQVGPIDREIEQVRKDIAREEKNTLSSNSSLAELSANGNSWARNELQKKVAKATKTDKKRLAKLQENRDKALSSITAAADKERNLAIADDTAAQQADIESKAAISTLFTTWGFGAKLLTILCRLLLVINFLINSPNWDANQDGVIDGADVAAAAQHSYTTSSTVPPPQPGAPAYNKSDHRRIGFKDYQNPDSRTGFYFGDPSDSSVPPRTVPALEQIQNTVEQCSTVPKPGTAAQQEQSAVTVPGASILADVKEWRKRCSQCFHRALNQQREEYRENNRRRTEAYAAMLRAVGVGVTLDFAGLLLEFKEPEQYTISDEAAAEIQRQQAELENIGRQ